MAEAEQEYRIIVEDNPRNPAALFDLASFLADADKKDEARKTLADLEKLNPPKDMQEAIGKLKAKLGAE